MCCTDPLQSHSYCSSICTKNFINMGPITKESNCQLYITSVKIVFMLIVTEEYELKFNRFVKSDSQRLWPLMIPFYKYK